MKKILFYLSVLITAYLAINVLKILVFDFKNLTNYGFGYLAGRSILLIIFAFITIKLKKYR